LNGTFADGITLGVHLPQRFLSGEFAACGGFAEQTEEKENSPDSLHRIFTALAGPLFSLSSTLVPLIVSGSFRRFSAKINRKY
jgi:hypothetical protein